MWNPRETLRQTQPKPGVCKSSVIDVVDGASKRSGAAMTTVVLETETGVRVFDHFVKGHPVAAARLQSLLSAIGFGDKEDPKNEDLLGKKLLVEIEIEDYQGVPQSRVKKYMPAEPTPAKAGAAPPTQTGRRK